MDLYINTNIIIELIKGAEGSLVILPDRITCL